MTQIDRDFLRTTIRTRRRQLSSHEQKQASEQLVSQVVSFLQSHNARTIALYLACDGELDTEPLIEWCWNNSINVCLPVLHPFHEGHLMFLDYTPTTPMILNRFQIPEPEMNTAHIVPKHEIDIIFTPLVAFDADGNRLGMGGGFYDRTLASATHRPHRLGLAHDFQLLTHELKRNPWDQPLDSLITPAKTYYFRR